MYTGGCAAPQHCWPHECRVPRVARRRVSRLRSPDRAGARLPLYLTRCLAPPAAPLAPPSRLWHVHRLAAVALLHAPQVLPLLRGGQAGAGHHRERCLGLALRGRCLRVLLAGAAALLRVLRLLLPSRPRPSTLPSNRFRRSAARCSHTLCIASLCPRSLTAPAGQLPGAAHPHVPVHAAARARPPLPRARAHLQRRLARGAPAGRGCNRRCCRCRCRTVLPPHVPPPLLPPFQVARCCTWRPALPHRPSLPPAVLALHLCLLLCPALQWREVAIVGARAHSA